MTLEEYERLCKEEKPTARESDQMSAFAGGLRQGFRQAAELLVLMADFGDSIDDPETLKQLMEKKFKRPSK